MKTGGDGSERQIGTRVKNRLPTFFCFFRRVRLSRMWRAGRNLGQEQKTHSLWVGVKIKAMACGVGWEKRREIL